MTPQTESRPSEKGLKKYASEAFRFVTDKKKTTYKEVASNLIQEMGDDYSIDKNVPLPLSRRKESPTSRGESTTLSMYS